MRLFKILGLMIMANVLIMASAHAFNVDFITDTPVHYFTKQDWKILTAAAQEALDKVKDGKRLVWQNPQSGAYGYFIPSDTHGNCRYLEIFNNARGMTGEAEYKFCKVKGEWKVFN